jgi:hypothetical protein
MTVVELDHELIAAAEAGIGKVVWVEPAVPDKPQPEDNIASIVTG